MLCHTGCSSPTKAHGGGPGSRLHAFTGPPCKHQGQRLQKAFAGENTPLRPLYAGVEHGCRTDYCELRQPKTTCMYLTVLEVRGPTPVSCPKVKVSAQAVPAGGAADRLSPSLLLPLEAAGVRGSSPRLCMAATAQLLLQTRSSPAFPLIRAPVITLGSPGPPGRPSSPP